MREKKDFYIKDPQRFAFNLVRFIHTTDTGIVLLDNEISKKISIYSMHTSFSFIAGINRINYCLPNSNKLKSLQNFIENEKDWMFGFLGYDLKNEIEKLHSGNFDLLGFDDLFFFIPELVIYCIGNTLTIEYHPDITDTGKINDFVDKISNHEYTIQSQELKYHFKSRFTKNEYLETIYKVLGHIKRGDIYEINICQEFFSNISIDPGEVFLSLNTVSPTPFAAYLKINNRYLLCASPERYIKKINDLLISQPIKGTIRKGFTPELNKQLQEELKENPKERSENIMITDLVRNDLAKIAEKGTVKVEELCGVYPFQQVNQMISTISCLVNKNLNPVEIIRATFPMGSMTGAPKVRAMQLIEQYEKTKRGLFSGAVGYITPDNDFDFNVVIRSLLYNQEKSYLSFTVGGAITVNSDPESEYQECLLKAEAIIATLNATIDNAG